MFPLSSKTSSAELCYSEGCSSCIAVWEKSERGHSFLWQLFARLLEEGERSLQDGNRLAERVEVDDRAMDSVTFEGVRWQETRASLRYQFKKMLLAS